MRPERPKRATSERPIKLAVKQGATARAKVGESRTPAASRRAPPVPRRGRHPVNGTPRHVQGKQHGIPRGRMRRPRDGRQQRQKNSSVKTSPAQARPAYTLQLQSQMQTSNRLPTGAAAAAAHGPPMQAAGAAQGAACTPNIKSRVCARRAGRAKIPQRSPGDAAARTHYQPAPPAALPWCGAKIITHPT